MAQRVKIIKPFLALFFCVSICAQAQVGMGFFRNRAAGGGGGATEFSDITAYTPGSPRNNFGSPVGFRFRPQVAMTVTKLGRWMISGNSGTHQLSIRNGSNTILASVNLDLSTGTPGQFNFVALSSPLTLTVGVDYYCLSVEVNGGDFWYEEKTATFSTDCNNYISAYVSGSPGVSTANWAFGPTNFKYTTP